MLTSCVPGNLKITEGKVDLEPTITDVTGLHVQIGTTSFSGASRGVAVGPCVGFSLTQPFSAAPVLYAGSESITNSFFVQNIANNNFVDWAYVELRSTQFAASIVSAEAGLIKNDGTIVSANGVTGLKFDGVADGDYYVVVYQKGFLPIMSKNVVTVENSQQVEFDMTLAANVYDDSFGPGYQIDGAVLSMAPGEWSLDGFIDGFDFTVWNNDNASTACGYIVTDVNKDGVTDGSDYTLYERSSNASAYMGFQFR
jgi:hypothetical protein